MRWLVAWFWFWDEPLMWLLVDARHSPVLRNEDLASGSQQLIAHDWAARVFDMWKLSDRKRDGTPAPAEVFASNAALRKSARVPVDAKLFTSREGNSCASSQMLSQLGPKPSGCLKYMLRCQMQRRASGSLSGFAAKPAPVWAQRETESQRC